MTKLQIAEGLALPLDAVTKRCAFLGGIGSGKTYAATKLAEEMLEAGAQVIAIDPVGVWYGLRLAKNGKDAGFAIPVFGGLHGDIPLEVGGGAYMADLLVDQNISAILDVSQFEYDSEKAKFAADWAKRFFFRKKAKASAVHVFLEECQEFVPQNPARGEELMLHSFNRMWKIGRNFGIGGSLISQRPQEVNKKALNLTQCMFAFQMNGPHERKTMREWISDQGLDTGIVDALPKLKIGHCHIWSPQWLDISAEYHIAAKRTLNVSSTPEVGKAAATRTLAPIDLDRIRTDMAATIERAKADDPKELKQHIKSLQRDLEKAQRATPAPPKVDEGALRAQITEQVQKAIAARDLDWTRVLRDYKREIEQRWDDGIKAMNGALRTIPISLPGAPDVNIAFEVSTAKSKERGFGHSESSAFTQRSQRVIQPPAARPSAVDVAGTNGDLSGPQKQYLERLAEFRAIGREQVRLAWVAASLGTTLRSRGFEENTRVLRMKGLVHKHGDHVELADAGLRLTGDPQPISGAELRARVKEMLSGPQAEYLAVLIDSYPQSVNLEGLAGAFGTTIRARGFEENVRVLRTNELATKQGEELRAADWLFVE